MTEEKLEQLRARVEASFGEGDINDFIAKADYGDYQNALAEMAIYQAELRAQFEELEEANVRVTQTASKLSELLDLMDDPYFILDHNLHIYDANRAAGLEFNLKHNKFFDTFADVFHRDDRPLVKAWIKDTTGGSASIEVTSKDEKAQRFKLKKHSFKDDTLLVIAKNITDLEKLASISETLTHSLHRIEQLQKERETAFAFLSHEMRTPASTIAMLIETDNTLSQTASGKLIQSNIDQVLSIMDDLKVVIKPDAEVFKAIHKVDLNVLVSDVLGSFSNIVAKKGITPHLVEANDFNPSISTNIQSLKQILSNLIKNAVMHSNAKNLWVSLSTVNINTFTSVVIKVSDDGTGILDTDKDRVFLPFQRGQTTSEGTGIGLDVCKRLATQLRGSIRLKDREGGGAEFIFTFRSESLPSPVDEMPTSQASEDVLNGTSVLFVEDDPVIRMLSGKILSNLGANVRLAHDGEDALKLIRMNVVSIVITDIMMPKLNGIELTKALREQNYKGLIIGCSAATVGDELDQILAAGANAVIPKPLTSKGLLSILSGLISTS